MGAILILGVIFGVGFWMVWAATVAHEAMLKAKHEAQRAYEDSLSALKLAPSDPDLKQQTLQLGRGYSQLTRDGKGVALFDEVALMNDLSAVCAGASAASSPMPTSGGPAREANIQTKLTELRQLYNAGLVSNDEYTTLRSELLGRLTAVDA
jgi:hypothetical protein